MELKTIKKISVLPFAQAVGAVFAVFGLLASIPMFLFMAIPNISPTAKLEALLIIVVYPAMLFTISFITSGIMAVVYNFIAPHLGGIKIEVE